MLSKLKFKEKNFSNFLLYFKNILIVGRPWATTVRPERIFALAASFPDLHLLKIHVSCSKLNSSQEITYNTFNELQYYCCKVLTWYTLSRHKTCSLGRWTFFSSRPSPWRQRLTLNTFELGNSNGSFLNVTPPIFIFQCDTLPYSIFSVTPPIFFFKWDTLPYLS